jgi:3-phytase
MLDNNGNFLSLERSFSTGVGNTIKLYNVSLEGATDIQNIDSLSAIDISTIKPVQKTLLLDFSSLGVPLDNIEGLALGPDLADGRRSLVVVSYNNFAATQFTQVLAFGVQQVPEPSSAIGILIFTAMGAKSLRRRKKG